MENKKLTKLEDLIPLLKAFSNLDSDDVARIECSEDYLNKIEHFSGFSDVLHASSEGFVGEYATIPVYINNEVNDYRIIYKKSEDELKGIESNNKSFAKRMTDMEKQWSLFTGAFQNILSETSVSGDRIGNSISSIEENLLNYQLVVNFKIGGIYGEAKASFITEAVHGNNYDANYLISENKEMLHDERKYKYWYSCEVINPENGKVFKIMCKDKVQGLPSWLSEDEYYKMCSLQQAQNIFETQVKLDGGIIPNPPIEMKKFTKETAIELGLI